MTPISWSNIRNGAMVVSTPTSLRKKVSDYGNAAAGWLHRADTSPLRVDGIRGGEKKLGSGGVRSGGVESG